MASKPALTVRDVGAGTGGTGAPKEGPALATKGNGAVVARFRGLERLYATPGLYYNVVTVAHLSLSGRALERLQAEGPRAVREAFVRHPRMRARQTVAADGDVSFFVPPPDGPLPDADGAWRVESGDWAAIAERLAETPFERTVRAPWLFTLVLPADGGDASGAGGAPCVRAALVVCADHSQADGFSTFAAVASVLSAATRDVTTTAPAPPAPLSLSIFDAVLGSGGGSCLSRAFGACLMPLAVSAVIDMYKKYKPLLPLEPSLAQFGAPPFPARHPTRLLFLDGTRQALVAGRARAREERTTLHGAYVAAMAAAYSRIKETTTKKPGRVCFTYDFDGNLRYRVQPPLPDDTVGYMIGISTIAQTSTEGFPLTMPFWDVARRMKALCDAGLRSFEASLTHRYMDRIGADAKSIAESAKMFELLDKGVVNDMNHSNLGKFERAGPAVYAFPGGGGDGVSIERVRLINSNCGPTSSLLVYHTTVADTPCYSCAYKTKTPHATRLFNNMAKAWEAIGTIAPGESLGAFAERVLGPQYNAADA